MKAIVEQYAKGEFRIDRPEVTISRHNFKMSIEAGTVYEGYFTVESRNDHPIKGMVYDSRYLLRFESHSFISRKFSVRYSFDATCLEAGQNFRGHINVITDGGEFRLPYEISILPSCVASGNDRIDDLFKFASLAERNWSEAARLFVSDDFRRTFINREPHLKLIYNSLLNSRLVDQAMEEFLVLVHKKRTVTLSTDKARLDLVMPAETESIDIELTRNTWGFTQSEIRSNAEFIIPAKKSITTADFTANSCRLQVYISPEHVPDGENGGILTIENIYQKIEIEIHLERPYRGRVDQENRLREQERKQSRINLTQAYLDFRMDRIGLAEYVSDTMEALRTLAEMEPEEDMYRLAVMHMNILSGDYSRVEQEFLRIEADVDRSLMSNQEKCYYAYLKAMVMRDEETTSRTANMIRRNYRTQEPKMLYFWLLLFVDPVYNEDKAALYRELTEMYEEGENSPIIYFELCDILNSNPLMLRHLTPFEITAVKWGMRHHFLSDDVLNEFVKLARKNKEFNKQIFDVLRSIYDKNEKELKAQRQELEKRKQGGKEEPSAAPAETAIDEEEEDEDGFVFTGFDDEGKEEEKEEVSLSSPDDPLRLSSEGESYDREKAQLEEKVQQSFNDHFDETMLAREQERILKNEQENLEVLSSICSMLISANMLDHRYHRFYKAAIESSLKYIGLNECYIRSMDRSHYERIPAPVLMYLNYKNTLNEDELAYLYANVIFNKSEHMKIYHEYAPTMEDFMEKMIMKGKVNDDLTVIYDEFLEPESVSSIFAGKLINIIFRRKLVCYNKNVRAVIVSHGELREVQHVPLTDGEAYVEILSDNASIIFEDKDGNRYAGSIPYHFERIVDEKAYMPICREYSPRDYRVLLFNYESIGEFTYRNAAEVNAAREIINCDEISDDYKQAACLNIIEYYHENLDTDVLAKYLRRLDIEYLTHANARTIITYLIDMNLFDKAFEAVKLYGFNELDVRELYRLADYGVQDSEGFLNENLMSICLNLYKTGTVNTNILTYMVMNFNGSIDELAGLFKLAKDRVSDISPLAENTLAQMMFTGEHLEYIYDVFATYYGGRSRGLVVKAFLRLSAHNYLIRDMQVPNYIFEVLYSEIQKGNIDDEISSTALLQYFSRLERYTNEQKKWITDTAIRFIDAGKILPFYKSFASFLKLPQDVFLKTYLIYKTEDIRQVYVRYSTGTRGTDMAQVHRMEEVVRGLYMMEFVIFHGERLVYSIEDDPEGNAQIVESEVLKKKSYNRKDMNRFEMINSMLVKQEMRKDKELLEDLDVYINTVHLFEENLTLL
ncbi:MAG: hypothetical protein IKQ49_11995 [Eubacterium sp.]|nr:hypothetical protein [Eubacterium sp.]